VLSKGRQSLSLALWRELVAEVMRLDRGRCANPRCRATGPLDPQHIKKRSQGGPDTLDNVIALCRKCHELADNATAAKRIIILSLGAGRFAFDYPAGEPAVHDRNLADSPIGTVG
jgi:hypothetical protein